MRLFRREKNNIEKNLEIYEQKKKAEQQEPKVLGQKPVKRKTNSQKSAIHDR